MMLVTFKSSDYNEIQIVIKVWLTIVNNVKDALSEGILRFIER